MNYQAGTDVQILITLGERIRKRRININLSQVALAEKSGISRRTVQAIEMGNSISMDKFIAILRSLDSLDELDNFISEVEISPLLLAKHKGKERKRAYRTTEVREDTGEYTW
ncbi:MAG: helix-turn-helix transcriptional regulator [Spirochaetales bacterium]|nr:helix-turn-helix transcriptional regulator [Spirochaetales bacterium]